MRRLLLTLVLGMELCACGGSSAPTSPASPSTPALTRVIALSGDMAFGSAQSGVSITAVLAIANSGTGTMTVSGLTLPSGFTANWTSGTISSGKTQPVAITFSATAVQAYGGTLTVNADQTGGTNTIGLSATGVLPSLNVPTLISPANGAVLPQGPIGNRPTWTFTWSAAPGTTAYRLYVKQSNASLPDVNQPGITSTTYAYVMMGGVIDANLQGWHWMVQSDEGWSQTGTFSVAPLSSTLSLTANSVLRDRRLDVWGALIASPWTR